MDNMDKKTGALLLAARIGMGLIFLASGFEKVAGWSGAVAYAATRGVPAILLAGATALEIFGAISLLAGWKTRWGAAALVAFLTSGEATASPRASRRAAARRAEPPCDGRRPGPGPAAARSHGRRTRAGGRGLEGGSGG